SPTAPFYLNGKVNVGNTNGKVVLQTFSLESLRRSADKFQGKIPMCFLLWQGGGATDLKLNTPAGYASFVNLGVEFKAHIIGPSIAGAPNNYPEMVNPWQDYLIKKSGLLNHPYSFDSREQMNKYFGLYNFGINGGQLFNPPYLDGAFTNRSEMTIQFFIDQKVRKAPAPQTVPDPEKLLTELGY
ncbi:MAG: glycerophosphodiester phosphodiesterase, partial [Muribaculaceae bacterium]